MGTGTSTKSREEDNNSAAEESDVGQGTLATSPDFTRGEGHVHYWRKLKDTETTLADGTVVEKDASSVDESISSVRSSSSKKSSKKQASSEEKDEKRSSEKNKRAAPWFHWLTGSVVSGYLCWD